MVAIFPLGYDKKTLLSKARTRNLYAYKYAYSKEFIIGDLKTL